MGRRYRGIRRLWRLILYIVMCTGVLAAVYVTQYFFPSRPTINETLEHVFTRLETATFTRQGLNLRHTDTQVLFIFPLKAGQLAVASYVQVEASDTASSANEVRYFEVALVRRYWFDGVKTISISQGRYPGDSRHPLSVIGMYLPEANVIVGATNNTRIVRIRATWSDGRETIVPLNDNTFFFVREDRLELAWLVGLDVAGQVVPNSLAYPSSSPAKTHYQLMQQFDVSGGYVIIGAFSSNTPINEACVELTYVTAEVAQKYLLGQAALTGQRACVEEPSSGIGPIITTVLNNTTTALGGWVLDTQIKRVAVLWSDGYEQTVGVSDGLYFAERRGTTAYISAVLGLDDERNIIAP